MTFSSLPQAISTAIRHGSQLEEINKARWAITYHTDESEIERQWIAALTRDTNSNSGGEGK